MKIIDWFECADQEHWRRKMEACDWRSGKYLCDLLRTGTLFEKTGADTKLLMLTDGKDLLSFCTLSEKKYDIVSSLSPWLGFVYTFPQYRGRRYSAVLLRHAEKLVHEAGAAGLYLSTKHVGLYEKYGFSFHGVLKDWRDDEQRIYFKPVNRMQ